MSWTALHAEAYRRCARRLRARLGGDPLTLTRALQTLSCEFDRNARQAPARNPAPDRMSGASGVRRFAEQVVQEIDESSLLLYSRRQELLRQARRQGIRRFDANLIIAAVQEHASCQLAAPQAMNAGRGASWRATAATVLTVQAGIVAAALLLLL